jgi:methylglutaconyl-CoA hydratase
MEAPLLVVRRDGPVAYVVLNRPEVRNAFNAALIAQLHRTFEALGTDESIRAIVLQGEGKTFCGGADINWMRASLDLTLEENVEDASTMSRMFRAIDRVPKPTVARIHGAALGGGAGLVAVCDIAIASRDTTLGFTETKLGILPAVISPFVLAKIGYSHARALALTGERFDATRAHAIGLVHGVVDDVAALDRAVAATLAQLGSASPTAIAATKELFARVAETPYDATLALTAQAIATQRTSPEGQDGLRAFLEKRPPAWAR